MKLHSNKTPPHSALQRLACRLRTAELLLCGQRSYRFRFHWWPPPGERTNHRPFLLTAFFVVNPLRSCVCIRFRRTRSNLKSNPMARFCGNRGFNTSDSYARQDEVHRSDDFTPNLLAVFLSPCRFRFDRKSLQEHSCQKTGEFVRLTQWRVENANKFRK